MSHGLHVIRISQSRDRAHLLDGFTGSDSTGRPATWVVADVRSKLAIQRRLLEKNRFAHGHAVLRASELWTMAVRKLEPDLQIVSRELILATIASRLQAREEAWLHAPGAAKTAFEYIKQLLPILSATDAGPGIGFSEWFELEENRGSKERWQHWFQIAASVWKELEHDRLCASSWVPGALARVKESLAAAVSRDLIVDLGAELSHVEADLLLEIAKSNRVTVFRPSPEWEKEYPDSRLAVDWMLKEASLRGVATSSETFATESVAAESRVIYKRLPSGGAEVKEAVARVRQWLEAGVSAQRIAIAAPDLESYWPVLSLHLEIEGLSANKPVVSMLHSFSDVMRWLARLRIRVGIPETRDLEADLFGDSNPAMKFTSFRELFSRIYEAADLDLSPELQKHFETEYQDRGRWTDEVLTRDVFLAKALMVLRENDDSGRAIRLFKTVLEECPPDIRFEASRWVKYLSEVAARVEVPVIAADPFGIACLNLASLEGVECTHVLVLGLHEGALRSQHGTVLHTQDLRAIESGAGFVVDGEDRKRVEFEARWILSQPRAETHLLFADADLGGRVQTPSWSWISGAWSMAGATPEMSVPLETRFDLLQRRLKTDVGSRSQRERAAREAGEMAQPNFGAGLVKSLSATTIDSVSKCALRFAFDRILGPRDEGALDLDADHSRNGRLQHKVFELLAQTQWRDHQDDELAQLIDKAREEIEAEDDRRLVRTEAAWQSLRRRLMRIARWILNFEIEERRRFPSLKTVGTEVSFRSLNSAPGDARITGQIDRIDRFEDGRLILIDYKNRAQAQNFSSWRKKNFWQPLLYAYALEKGWIEGFSESEELTAKLVGIFIYDIRDRSKGTGYRLREGNEDVFEFTSRSKGQTRDELDEAFTDLEVRIREVSACLEYGAFLPEPADANECTRCRWRSSCRAPHLELL